MSKKKKNSLVMKQYCLRERVIALSHFFLLRCLRDVFYTTPGNYNSLVYFSYFLFYLFMYVVVIIMHSRINFCDVI
jgi:hypothetical protein